MCDSASASRERAGRPSSKASRRAATRTRRSGSRYRDESRTSNSVSLEADEGVDDDILRRKARRPAEIGQIDDEGRRDDLAARAADQLDGGLGGAARRDQIVDQQDLVALADRIGMD